MSFPILSSLILLPTLGAIFILFGRSSSNYNSSKYISLFVSLANFILSLYLWYIFDKNNPSFQFVEERIWLEGFINYKVGIDGISILFIILTTFITSICIISVNSTVKTRLKDFLIAILIMETMMIGVFCSLDLVIFYLFFEAGLIPMFLIIGIWGGERRVYSAFKFFLYTLLGSVLMLVAIISIYWIAGTTDVIKLYEIGIDGKYQNRYDVTLLINGLPLVQIELKRRGVEMGQAFHQIVRYKRNSYSSGAGLFQYVQLFIISNGVNTKYFANNKTLNYKQTFYWSDVNNKKISALNEFTDIFLKPHHLSKMVSKVTNGIFTSIGIVFTDTPKHEVSYGLLVDKTGATDLDLTDRSHETVLGEDIVVGKDKIGTVSGLNKVIDSAWRVKDISQLKTFLKYLQAYSKIPVKLTKKFEGDLEGKINAELKNGQARAKDLKKNMQSVEGDDSLAELQKTSSIIEPVFIQGLKQVINEVTSGKLKLK